MTTRIDKFKENYINTKPTISTQRAKIFTASHKKTEGEPICIRRAKAFLAVAQEISTPIFEDEIGRAHV